MRSAALARAGRYLAGALLAWALASSPALSAPRYRLKLAHVIGAGTPIDVAAHRLAELVRQRTQGKVEISVFPAAQFGGERAIIEGVQLGAIDMSLTTTGPMGGLAPEFHVLDLPYLFPSYEAAYTYLDGENGRRLLALLDRRGIHGLAFFENGWRNFTSSRNPLKRPEDLEGQKIRVMECTCPPTGRCGRGTLPPLPSTRMRGGSWAGAGSPTRSSSRRTGQPASTRPRSGAISRAFGPSACPWTT